MELDLASWGGIAATVTVLTSAVKYFWPDLSARALALISILLGPVLAAGAKLSGLGWADTGWFVLVLAGIFCGLGGQVIHDKALNPLLGKNPSA